MVELIKLTWSSSSKSKVCFFFLALTGRVILFLLKRRSSQFSVYGIFVDRVEEAWSLPLLCSTRVYAQCFCLNLCKRPYVYSYYAIGYLVTCFTLVKPYIVRLHVTLRMLILSHSSQQHEICKRDYQKCVGEG